MTFATVSFTRCDITLTGYAMNDGTFQFIIGDKMQVFNSLLEVWSAWADIH